MEYGLAVAFIGTGLWLKYMPSRAMIWFQLGLWCLSNGNAAVERARARKTLMAEARKMAEGGDA